MHFSKLLQPLLVIYQAPGSWSQPCEESKEKKGWFLGPPRFNIKVYPESYVLFGSYRLLLRNAAHKMNEIIFVIKKKFP